MNEKSTILIIDDDQRNIFALSAVLKAKGFPVRSTQSADEGVMLIQTDKDIKVVLMDIMMPDMDGYEAISKIRQHEDPEVSKTPIIAVTAKAMVGDREKTLEGGADGYISKPIDVDELIRLLDTF